MAGESPVRWIGRRVKVYLFHAGTPDVDEHTTYLLGVNELGVTVSGIPTGTSTFYPWGAVRQIDNAADDGGVQRQASTQRQQVDPGSLTPTFPQVRM